MKAQASTIANILPPAAAQGAQSLLPRQNGRQAAAASSHLWEERKPVEERGPAPAKLRRQGLHPGAVVEEKPGAATGQAAALQQSWSAGDRARRWTALAETSEHTKTNNPSGPAKVR